MTWWWISLSHEDGFLGGVTVCAESEFEAIQRAAHLNLLPSVSMGEAALVSFPEEKAPLEFKVERFWRPEEIMFREDFARVSIDHLGL